MKLRGNLSQEQLNSMVNGFKVLKEIHTSKSGTNIIKEALEKAFDADFEIYVVPYTNQTDKMFVMSVFPEASTVDKILQCVTANKSNMETVTALWEKNKKWTIEIDEAILDIGTERELVAILLHEIGHIANDTSIPSRIVTILQYEYANTKMHNKLLMKNSIFRNILSIPVMNACTGDQVNGSIKEEVEADKYVKKCGYAKELISILHKLMINPKYPGANLDKEMKDVTNFSIETLDNLRTRQDKLAKNKITLLEKTNRSPMIESTLATIHRTWFLTEDQVPKLSGRDYLIQEEVKSKNIHDIADRTEYEYYREFGIFGKKKLEKLDMYDIDYIETKRTMIKTDTDKLVLIGYIHNKIDQCQFYIDILNDPKESKKYKVPHSMQYLKSYLDTLLKLREEILKVRIRPRDPGIVIGYTPNTFNSSGYPAGYEG